MWPPERQCSSKSDAVVRKGPVDVPASAYCPPLHANEVMDG